jgi:hypothetical protein
MTEDETFKKLSRISFDEMIRLFKDWNEPIDNFNEVIKFFEGHKWTYQEYIQEMIKKDGLY